MKAFDIEEARKMSNDEVMAIVCEGLAEFCESLADKSDSRLQGRILNEQASHFKAFSQFYARRAANKEVVIGEKQR